MPVVIIVEPVSTDSNYEKDLEIFNGSMDSIRKRVSPDALDPITARQLPNTFINDPIFIEPAEAQVLAHKKMRAADVASHKAANDAVYQELLVLTEIRVCIEMLPQLPQQVRRIYVGVTTQSSEVKISEKISQLEMTYKRIISPSTDIPSGTETSLPAPVVRRTRSRL